MLVEQTRTAVLLGELDEPGRSRYNAPTMKSNAAPAKTNAAAGIRLNPLFGFVGAGLVDAVVSDVLSEAAARVLTWLVAGAVAEALA
jgi:hypothetical protein